MNDSDASLLRKWQTEQDADAFSELVCRHAAMVFNACAHVIGDGAQAEELAQECFEELSQSPLKIEKSLAAWLHTVATHHALSRLRSEHRRKAREMKYADEQPATTEPGWDDIKTYVDEAVTLLPAGLREVIVLRFFDGKTHDAVAQELGVARATVQRRQQRGIEGIRKQLESKNIAVSAAALGVFLEAVPTHAATSAVLASLGKFAGRRAVSGPSQAALVQKSAAAVRLGMLKAAIVALGVGLLSIGMWRMSADDHPTPEGREAVASEAVASIPSPSEARNDGAVVLPPSSGEPLKDTKDNAQASAQLLLHAEHTLESPLTSSVSGYVMDEEGNAVEGATVFLMASGVSQDDKAPDSTDRREDAYASKDHHFWDVTDRSGAFQLVGISYSGSYSMSAHIDGFHGQPVEGQRAYGQIPYGELVAGENIEGVNFILRPSTTLFGRIVTADGEAVSDAVVKDTSAAPTVTYTDGEGYFRMEYQNPTEANRFLSVVSSMAGRRFFTKIPVGSEEVIELSMAAGAVLSGTITWEDSGAAADGLVVHLDASRMSSMTVNTKEQEGVLMFMAQPDRSAEATVNRNGYFQIDNLDPASSYNASVRDAEGRSLTTVENFHGLRSGETQTWDKSVHGIIRITGRVLGTPSGRPARDNIVEVLSEGIEYPLNFEIQADGSYEAEILTGPGEYSVSPKYGHRPLNQNDPLKDCCGETVELLAGEVRHLDLTMPDAVTASIHVVDADGQSIEAAQVQLNTQMGWRNFTENGGEAGHYLFAGFVPGEEGLFHIWKDGYIRVDSAPIVGRPGDILPEQTVVLLESCGVEGILLDADGEPLTNMIINADAHYGDGQTARLSQTSTYSDGSFSWADGVPATEANLELTVEDSQGRKQTWSSASFTSVAGYIANLGEIILGESEWL
jgi:RNA polymerase sigma-70 factor (ECF subfamily)